MPLTRIYRQLHQLNNYIMNYLESKNILPDNMYSVLKKINERGYVPLITGSIALAGNGVLCRAINDIDIEIPDCVFYRYNGMGSIISSDYPQSDDVNYIYTRMLIDGVKVCFFRILGTGFGWITPSGRSGIETVLKRKGFENILIEIDSDIKKIVEYKQNIGTKKHLDDVKFINWAYERKNKSSL